MPPLLMGNGLHLAQMTSQFRWNASSEDIDSIHEGHWSRVFSATFSPDETRVVSVSRDHTVHMWNASTGVIEHVLTLWFGELRCLFFWWETTRVRFRGQLSPGIECVDGGYTGGSFGYGLAIAFSRMGDKLCPVLWTAQSVFGMQIRERPIEYCRSHLW